MPKDRLHDDSDRIENLDDLIEAREERTSALADDIDGMDDIDSSDVDVDEALTFPHPKKNPSAESQDIDLMDTPQKDDVGFDYQDSAEEMLPAEYTNDYNAGLTTHFSDEEDDMVDEELEDIGEVGTEDLIYNTPSFDLPERGGPKGMEEDRAEE